MSQLDEGEIKVWMIFEVLAATKEAAQESLKDHAEKLSEEDVNITKEDFETVQEVEKPHPEVEKGYSKVYELEDGCQQSARATRHYYQLRANYGRSNRAR